MYHPFSVAETVKTAWNVLKKNFATFIVYSILTLVINGLMDILMFILFDDTKVNEIIVGLLKLIVQSYLALSFYKLILTLMDKQYYEFEFKEIWPSFHAAYRVFVIELYYVLLVIVFFTIVFVFRKYDAIVFLIEVIELIVFFYLLLRSIFCICFIADDDSGAIESLKQSFAITKDNFFKTLGIFLIIIGFMAAVLIPIAAVTAFLERNSDESGYQSRLAFYTWFVITFPAVQVLIMVTYRKLVYSHMDVDDDIAETN